MEQFECLYDRYIRDFRCKYYLIKSTKKFLDEEDKIEIYGVKIDKINKEGQVLDSNLVKDVGINKADVQNFIKFLNDGQVTPLSLEDVVADHI